ncbi:putative acetyltransferase protein [Mycena sanguinolenta]|uniref:Putative acetyltransferase protein n=1 Tax=Mycena sanguinolenta TaxID=230812 RepID=A0A8H7CX78_9AGAR|nr:putative acetyltransferase protein [Mycena sanguinolenta]
MADTTSQPFPLVVPRPGGDVIIRQFLPKDADQLHALLVEGVVYGREFARIRSPFPELITTILKRNRLATWRSGGISSAVFRSSRTVGGALGLGSYVWSTNPAVRMAGGALALCATALFAYRRHSITKMFVHFCATARATDMADIPRTYEVPVSEDGTKPQSQPQGPSAFWVAVIESPDYNTSEIVGYLGLDYHANSDPSTAELRRLTVSARHRRRKIASLLMSAALAHARLYRPLLTTLELETSEFQPGARRLYENLGFSLVGSRIMRIGPLFAMTVIRLRRNILD